MEDLCTCEMYEVHRWKPNLCASCLHRKHDGTCQFPGVDQQTANKRALPNVPPQTVTPPTPSTETKPDTHENPSTTTEKNVAFEKPPLVEKHIIPSLERRTSNEKTPQNEKTTTQNDKHEETPITPHNEKHIIPPLERRTSDEKTTPQNDIPTTSEKHVTSEKPTSDDKHTPPPLEKYEKPPLIEKPTTTERRITTPPSEQKYEKIPVIEKLTLNEKHTPPQLEKYEKISMIEKPTTNTSEKQTPPSEKQTTAPLSSRPQPPISIPLSSKTSENITNLNNNITNNASNNNNTTKLPQSPLSNSPSGRLLNNLSIGATLSFSSNQTQTVIEPPVIVEPEIVPNTTPQIQTIKDKPLPSTPQNAHANTLFTPPERHTTRHQKSNTISGGSSSVVPVSLSHQKGSKSFLLNSKPVGTGTAGDHSPTPLSLIVNHINAANDLISSLPDPSPSILNMDGSCMDPTNVYMKIMLRLFKVMGLSVDDKLVKDFLVKAETESRIKNRPVPIYRYWTSSTGNSSITNIMNECLYFLKFEKDIQKVVKVQSIVRGYLGRKRYTHLQKYFVTPYKERNHILSDIIKNEIQYIDKLNLMIKSYLTPLRAQLQKGTSILSSVSSAPILSNEDLRCIFSNVEIIRGVHEGLLRDLQNLDSSWPAIESIGESILRKAPDLKVYGEYVTNIKAALDTFNRVSETNPKFVQFLDERQAENHMDPGLMALMSVPLNQISQYSFQLSKLVKATPPSFSDHDALLSASVIMGESYNLITQAMNQSSERALLLDVQRRLVPGYVPSDLDLFSLRAPRTFKTEGSLLFARDNKIHRSTPYHYFLFSDVLLVSKPHKNLFKPKYIIYIKELEIEDASNQFPAEPTFPLPFFLNFSKKKILVSMPVKTDRTDFLAKINEIKEILNPNTRVFGVSLVDIIKREKPVEIVATELPPPPNGIPIIIDRLIVRLKNELKTDGIFRINCKQAELITFRSLLETEFATGNVTYTKLDTLINKYEIHVISNALKCFFRELPEPLLPYSLYEPLMMLAEQPQDSTRVSNVKQTLQQLSGVHKTILQYLFSFLGEVVKNAEFNRMTASNLAIVFGPNLLRPRTITLETTLSIPKANSIIEDMIVNHATLFT